MKPNDIKIIEPEPETPTEQRRVRETAQRRHDANDRAARKRRRNNRRAALRRTS